MTIRLLILSILLGALLALPAAAGPQFEAREHQDRPYLIALPDTEPRGLVFAFHGRGGNEGFATRATAAGVMQLLSEAGYVIVSPQSTAQGRRRGAPGAGWNHSDTDIAANPDLARLFDLYDRLVADAVVTPQTPVFTMGMSNGGGMAVFFGLAAQARGLPVIGIANYMGPFPAKAAEFMADQHDYPAMFAVIAENDGLVSGENQKAAISHVRGEGGYVELHLVREDLVTVDALVAQGAPVQEAGRLVAGLQTGGIIDDRGVRLYRPGEVIGREDAEAFQSAVDMSAYDRQTRSALLRVLAGHQMRDDYAHEQLAFFGRARILAETGQALPLMVTD